MSDQHVIYDGINLLPDQVNETEVAAEEQKNELFLQCPLKYSFANGNGEEATAELYTESLVISPRIGEVLTFSLREINNVLINDYQIFLDTISGENLTLFHIGYNYENFARVLNQLYSEVLLKDLLFQETLKQPSYRAAFRHEQSGGVSISSGICGIRLYETALVLLPEFARPIRFPYSDITDFQDADYTVTINTDFGERIVLTKLGSQFSPFLRDLGNAMNELSQKTQAFLHGLWPEFDLSVICKMAHLMPEGKTARCGDLKNVGPAVWPKLEETILDSGIGKEYQFLKSLSQPDEVTVGLKRGLMGDLTGTYLWFLVPIPGLIPGEPGNAIAMEAVTINPQSLDPESETETEAQGKATYFFRMVNRQDFHPMQSPDHFKTVSDMLIRKICRCLQAVNFRREPIYLPDESLKTPRYLKYFYAMQSIPGLQELRELYIGRVMHRSEEQWRNDVLDLLKFNTGTQDNSLKWFKNKTNQ